VVFKERIRDEIKFSGTKSLMDQIDKDIDIAKKYFSTNKN